MLGEDDLRADIEVARAAAGPWLMRSYAVYLATTQRNGYPGDFQTIEAMYDLEPAAGFNAFQGPIANCVDGLFAHTSSTPALWWRRRAFADLVANAFKSDGTARILDVACGGARYIQDALNQAGDPDAEIVLLDQDPAAIAFCEHRVFPGRSNIRYINHPIGKVTNLDLGGQFDLIIVSGLFDYLADDPARALLAHLSGRMNPGGLLAMTNFSLDDRSSPGWRWLLGWELLLRTEQDVAGLFPDSVDVVTEVQAAGSMIFATATNPRDQQ